MNPADRSGSLDDALANGRALLAADPRLALEQAQAILEVTPDQADALYLSGRALRALSRDAEARTAEDAAIAASLSEADMQRAAAALAGNALRDAEHLLRARLARSPDDAAAKTLLADVAARVGIYAEAERQLRAVLDQVPDYAEARIGLAQALSRQGRIDESLAELAQIVRADPGHVRAAALKAETHAQVGDYEAAADTYRSLLAEVPDHAEAQMWFGHLLKTMGRQGDSIAAYRGALALDPALAEAWWALSELKAKALTDDDIVAMERALEAEGRPAKALFLHFALGRGFEDRRLWAESFDHYATGNAIRLELEPHDRAAVTRETDESIAIYDRRFFAARAGAGASDPDPIFIVGMPRAGSTLVEQILDCHSQVEGTSELPLMPMLVQSLVARDWRRHDASYPALVPGLSADELTSLGRRYLEGARTHRRTDAPFFTDKLPNNWRYLGLIHAILPNAKVVDARREPMACCFSNYKQHFAQGQTFAYALAHIGAYYRDYVRAMAHFATMLPGRQHLVRHEALLASPETEIRSLLDYLGLPFEEACLRPHENARAVRTASSEQVRRPINTGAVDLWRHYAPWLGDLEAALGDAR
jgi:tetratricopeptide (TPR) repeat protein